MRSAGNEECGKRGKCGVWKTRKMWSVENEENVECGKRGVWKIWSLENVSLRNRTLVFQAIKNVSKKVNKRIKRVKHYCQ